MAASFSFRRAAARSRAAGGAAAGVTPQVNQCRPRIPGQPAREAALADIQHRPGNSRHFDPPPNRAIAAVPVGTLAALHRHRHEARGKELTPRLRIFAGGQAGPHSAIVARPGSTRATQPRNDRRACRRCPRPRSRRHRPGRTFPPGLLGRAARCRFASTRGHSPAPPIPCPRRCDPNHPAVGIRPKPHGPVTGLSDRFGQARLRRGASFDRRRNGRPEIRRPIRSGSSRPGRAKPSPVERWVSPLELRPLLQLGLQERRDFRCRLFRAAVNSARVLLRLRRHQQIGEAGGSSAAYVGQDPRRR